MKKIRNILLWILAVVLVLGGAFGIYAADYYHADPDAISGMMAHLEYEYRLLEDGTRAYYPKYEEYDTALVFYPGGKVEYSAYEPLMAGCAGRGYLCLLVEMPANLAVLDANAARRVMDQYPEVEHWYLAGHSLGGSMAASCAAGCADVEGVILLAAYSTEDLGGKLVLSIRGTEDQVLNGEKYEQYRENLPENFTEVVISGGCHAWFGVYGPQEGDGTPTITNQEQIERTVQEICDFLP